MCPKELLMPACICQIFITSHFIIKKNCTVQYWLKILCDNQSVGNGNEVIPRKAVIDEGNAQFVVTVAGP